MDTASKILLLNDSFPPLIDGVANAVINYGQHLPKYGFSPTVLTPDHPQADDSQLSFPVIRYPSIDLRSHTGGYMAGVPFSPELAGEIHNQKISLIHTHCPIVSTFLARELRQVTNAPIVLTYHTKFDIDIANLIRSKAIQTGSKHALVKNIAACDEIWAVSRGAADNLRSLGFEGSITVMPNGVDLPLGRVSDETVSEVTKGYDLPQGIPVFLFVGRIMWYKGLRIILDALAKLKAAGKDFRMVFIGGGQDFQEVTAYTQTLCLNDKVFFTGPISGRENLRAWYCRGSLFLFPSTFDTNGLVVREAAACSLGSMLISGSCAAEDVTDGQNAFLIEENAESMYAALNTLCDNPGLMKKIGENAAKEIYMSWEDAVRLAAARYEVVIDLYRSGHYAKHHQPVEDFFRLSGEFMDDLSQIQSHARHINVTVTERMNEHLETLRELIE